MKIWLQLTSAILVAVGFVMLGYSIENLKFIQIIAAVMIYTSGVISGMEIYKN